MGRNNNKNKIYGGFVPFTYEMMDSKAFRELTGAALKALIFCMRKVKTHHPIDRFRLHFSLTYAEAKKQGLTDSTFRRGIKQLQELGFIDCVMKGGMRFQGKACSLYRLSQRWKDYGTSNFKKLHDGYCEVVHG
jgi:hypothetical protein